MVQRSSGDDNSGEAHGRVADASWSSQRSKVLHDREKVIAEPANPKRSRHTRPKSPELRWVDQYSPAALKRGRVLVVDYLRSNQSTRSETRKVAAQEINNVKDLQKLYNGHRRADAALRLYHVQNADWAEDFLLKKFNINWKNDLVGSDFGRYVSWKHPMNRGGKPRVTGKSWSTQHDPWRGTARTSIGLDYLKTFEAKEATRRNADSDNGKMMELDSYSKDSDEPKYMYDVHAQRLSFYFQAQEDLPETPDQLDIENPYEKIGKKPGDYFPDLANLDNGNAIIIFEHSQSGSIVDTLIPARGTWESRWRRLPYYLAYENQPTSTDSDLAKAYARTIISDIWKALAEEWQQLLEIADNHVEILESKIYERPADESRVDEIWSNSNNWLRCERLAYVHRNMLEEFIGNIAGMTVDESEAVGFLDANRAEFDKIVTLVEEDLIKPTANLSDLMYKSVEIRDSRHSLELSYSMWRLSWITFIFLPLTFTSSFFGMNVTVIADNPDIKWYFITSVPLIAATFLFWLITKHLLFQTRQTPYARGVYERFFHDLALNYPFLWSRTGPRPLRLSRVERIKWRMITLWNKPAGTIENAFNAESDAFDGLSTWARLKRSFTRKWTAEIADSHTQEQENSILLSSALDCHNRDSGAPEMVPDEEKPTIHALYKSAGVEASSEIFGASRRDSDRLHSESVASRNNSEVIVEEQGRGSIVSEHVGFSGA